MKVRVSILIVAIFLSLTADLFAGENIVISGMQIPVMEGAVPIRDEPQRLGGMSLAAYLLDSTLDTVVTYYESFLKENSFAFMGGRQDGGFNASVAKGNVLFTLKISRKGRKTIIEFIW